MESKVKQGSLWAFPESDLAAGDSLLLFDNVQFIYELALAELELKSFGIQYQVMNGLRCFKLGDGNAPDILRRRLAYFKAAGERYTDYFYIVRANRTRSVNQYLTHWIYPYKGKFHPQMIRALLNIIGLKAGDTVLDPFVGSGTAALEAQLLGINCVGIDVSPLCVLQSRVKTESIGALPEIENQWQEILRQMREESEAAIPHIIDGIAGEPVSNFFKVAWLVAHSDRARRRKNLLNSFMSNAVRMIQSVRDYSDIVRQLGLTIGKVDIYGGDARDLPLLKESIDGVITSPPYSIALDYIVNDAHALKALNYDLEALRERFIGVRGRGAKRIELYNKDMIQCFAEMARVLKPGGYCVIVIGDATYSGANIPTVKFTIEECGRRGLRLVKNMDKIIYGLYNVMKSEKILILQKY